MVLGITQAPNVTNTIKSLTSSRYSTVATVGLFITGLGVANLYPLTLALAAAPGQTDKANARTQLLIGAAVESALIAIALALLLFAGRHKAI